MLNEEELFSDMSQYKIRRQCTVCLFGSGRHFVMINHTVIDQLSREARQVHDIHTHIHTRYRGNIQMHVCTMLAATSGSTETEIMK